MLAKVVKRVGSAVVLTPLVPKKGDDVDVHASVEDFQRIPILGEIVEYSAVTDETGVLRAKDIQLLKPDRRPRLH